MLRRNLLPLKFAVFLCALLLYYPHLNLMAEPELCLTRLSIKFVNGARVYSVCLQTNLDTLYLNLRDTFLISKSFRF